VNFEFKNLILEIDLFFILNWDLKVIFFGQLRLGLVCAGDPPGIPYSHDCALDENGKLSFTATVPIINTVSPCPEYNLKSRFFTPKWLPRPRIFTSMECFLTVFKAEVKKGQT